MIDIHSHVIPGVDDGAADLTEGLLLLNQAWNQGITTVFATPHSDAFLLDRNTAMKNFASLHSLAKRFLPGLRLYLGCEVLCEGETMDKTIARLQNGTLPTLGGTEFVLTEFSPWGNLESANTAIFRLLNAGFTPVIAHPERYSFLEFDEIRRFRDAGALLQVNAYSLGVESDPIREKACRLAKAGLISFLGTDMHSTTSRPPSVTAGLNWLSANCDGDYVNQITTQNALDFLNLPVSL